MRARRVRPAAPGSGDQKLRGQPRTLLERRATERLQQTLEQAIDSDAIDPLDIQATADSMLAYLEGVLLLAKTQNDPEIIRRLGPAIKTLRIEADKGN